MTSTPLALLLRRGPSIHLQRLTGLLAHFKTLPGWLRFFRNVVSGKGLCFETTCAWWPPLYPLFLALMALLGKHYLLIVIPQALIGTGTVLLAFLIGREIFGVRVGLVASIITAFYPYYVMHDTALQETGMMTFFVALSVWFLLRASRLNRGRDWFFAGLALGAIALTRASTAPFIPLALMWTAWIGAPGDIKKRLTSAAVIVLALTLTVGPWLIRTWRVSGAPVLSSQTGRARSGGQTLVRTVSVNRLVDDLLRSGRATH